MFFRYCIIVYAALYAALPATAQPTLLGVQPVFSQQAPDSGEAQDTLSSYIAFADGDSAIIQFCPPSQGTISTNDYELDSAVSLPAGPPGVLLTLIGFVCASLIWDRRSWVTVCTGLFMACESGVQPIPRVAYFVRHRTQTGQRQSCRAVKLLDGHFEKPIFYFSQFAHQRTCLIRAKLRAFSGDYHLPHSAVLAKIRFSDSNGLRLVCGTGQIDYFQPALSFCRIPRGPPIPA